MADTLVRLDSFPFDSKSDGYDDDGYPVYDRAVDAGMLRDTFKKFFTDGVFPNPANALQISKADGMQISISPGLFIINGAMGGIREKAKLFTLIDGAAKGVINVSVMLRFDENDDQRACFIRIAASNPGESAPSPESGVGIKEYRLGTIAIPNGATDLSKATVKNEKGLATCPFAAPFENIDVDAIVSDFRVSANEGLADLVAFFDKNRELIQSALDETTAGHLQNQITELQSQLDNFDLAGSVDDTTIKYGTKPGSAKKALYIPDGAVTSNLIAANAVGKINIDSTLVELIETKPVGLDINAYTIEELVSLVANPKNTTESLNYLVGKEKVVEMSGFGKVPFRVVGVRQDTMANGSSNCITFQACNIIANHNMNSTNVTTGGYAKSAMKSYIDSTIYNSYPSELKKYIVTVNKKMAATKGGSISNVACKGFIATMFEVYGSSGTGTANEGKHYKYWADNTGQDAHIMYQLNSSSASSWWTCSVYDSTSFCYVGGNGNAYNYSASDSYGVVPCFCIGKS